MQQSVFVARAAVEAYSDQWSRNPRVGFGSVSEWCKIGVGRQKMKREGTPHFITFMPLVGYVKSWIIAYQARSQSTVLGLCDHLTWPEPVTILFGGKGVFFFLGGESKEQSGAAAYVTMHIVKW